MPNFELYSARVANNEEGRTSLVFSAAGMRHDIIPRDTDSFQCSSIFLLQKVLGDFFSFTPICRNNKYVGTDIADLRYGGMPVFDTGFILKYDFTISKLLIFYLSS